MAINSTSSWSAVVTQYEDNLCYDINESAPENALFIQAARILLRREAAGSTKGTAAVCFVSEFSGMKSDCKSI